MSPVPLYEYQCPKDGRFELIRKFSDPPLESCPTCGQPVEKLVSSPAFQFKGTGWYITDYARKGNGDGEREKGDKPDKAGKADQSGSKDASTGGKGDSGGKPSEAAAKHSDGAKSSGASSSSAESSQTSGSPSSSKSSKDAGSTSSTTSS